MSTRNDSGCCFNVVFKSQVRGIDHHGTELAAGNRVGAGSFVTVIEMDGKVDLGVNRFGAAEKLLQHDRVSVLAHRAGELHNDWSPSPGSAFEQPMDLLQVADVKC